MKIDKQRPLHLASAWKCAAKKDSYPIWKNQGALLLVGRKFFDRIAVSISFLKKVPLFKSILKVEMNAKKLIHVFFL